MSGYFFIPSNSADYFYLTNDVMEKASNEPFFSALQEGDINRCKSILELDPSLAGRNFLPESLHSDGFPLYLASKANNFELVKLFLEFGADPDAALDLEDPREVGMPLLHALEVGNFEMIHLLLDHGARLNAFPYCSTPFVDQVCNGLWEEPSSEIRVAQLMSKSYSDFIPFNGNLEASSESASPLMLLLERITDRGGMPSLFTLVRHQHHELLRSLLTESPNGKGTAMDWPKQSVFQNIVQAASWCGYPETLAYCKTLCPNLYSMDVAKGVIERAIRSHNRDGCIDDYFELIKAELEFLERHAANSKEMSNGDTFDPIQVLETDFIEPKNYGFKCPHLLTTADLERVRRLLIQFGY